MREVCAELGVEPVINACGPVTVYGGSLMPPEVVEAMASASRAFVDMHELHLAAGKRIAALVGAEAAHVCAGAAAGIALMAAACMAGSDPKRIAQLPDTSGMKHLFVAQRAHRNGFYQSVRLAGGRFLEVGVDVTELKMALGPEVAAIYHTAAAFSQGEELPLPQVAELAHAAGLPVLVDAAAQLPPAENLTRFLKEGGDLVTFSGGKALRGPQSSGLIIGRADLIEACRLNDCPNMSVGRPMKASKEDIAGLVKAVELYVKKDHAAEMALWEGRVARMIEALSGLAHVRVWRTFPYGVAQQVPVAVVSWDETALGLTHEEAARRLLQGQPRVAVRLLAPDADYTADTPELRLYPDQLQEGEEVAVAARLRELLL